MCKRRHLSQITLVVLGALVLLALFATGAQAMTLQTRVQAVDQEVCPYITTEVSANTQVPLTGGGVFTCQVANPLAALYLSSLGGGFSCEVSQSDFGVFVDKIAGYGDPVAWSNWWLFAVNGYMSPLGASSFEAQDGDQFLWMNVPSTAPWNNMALVVNGPTTVALGQTSSFTVVGDDLGKVNSQADATRFGLDASAVVETPAQFAALSGATVHVGATEQTADAAGQVTVAGLVPGAYPIWAEKAYDANFFYVSSTQAATYTVPFSDVPAGNPYYAAIHQIAGLGIVGGYQSSPTQIDFRPGNTLYRAQFAKMIAIALGLEVVEGSTSPFTDLDAQNPANLYPHDYVAAAYEAGLTNGLTTTTFGPYKDISRAQVVTLVVRAAQKLAAGTLETPTAGYASTWGTFDSVHSENARIAEYNGLLDGLSLTTTSKDPWGAMTRGETAQVLANLVELLGE
jgi:hypothetical protein